MHGPINLRHPYLKGITLYHTWCWLTGAFWRNSELSIFVVAKVAADLDCRTMKQNVTHRPEDARTYLYVFLWMKESDAICMHRLWNKQALSVKHYFAGHNFYLHTVSTGGQDSPVGVATRYQLDGLGTETRRGATHFHARQDRPRGPPRLLHYTMCNGYLPGSKAAGVWCWSTIPFQRRGCEGVGAIPPPSISVGIGMLSGDFCLLYLDVDKRSICTGCLWSDTTPG
jgi:hypothetical protein